MTWNPHQYLKFAQPRLRPALDLLAHIPLHAPRRVFDLGCGTGNVTRVLRERWPGAAITGVDASEAMIERAAHPGDSIEWIRQDLDGWRATEPADVLYSNAALHWLGDHRTLFPGLFLQLAPGGVLAVQMPRNFAAPSHMLIAEVARDGAWRVQLEPLLTAAPVGDPSYYYGLLAPLGGDIDSWETEYLHVLHGPDPVKEWVKGTWLKPFLDRLQEPQRAAFEDEYARRVRAAYPPRADGVTLFPFRRLFIIARRACST